MVSTMRSIGVGINLYQLDHSSTLPGPLWPGQVAEYSQIEDGRLVVRLAPYLGIPEKDAPYIVPGYLTPALRKSVPSIVPEEIRVFVMNMSVAGTSGNVNPWGSLTPPISAPLARSAISKASAWAMREAYASHPAVITRPWRTSTPPVPLYGKKPLGLFFDGSVGFFDPAEGP